MGASALFSALNAIPWDDGDSESSSDEEDSRQKGRPNQRMSASGGPPTVSRPKSQLLSLQGPTYMLNTLSGSPRLVSPHHPTHGEVCHR